MKKWRERKSTYVRVPENADTGVRQNCTFLNQNMKGSVALFCLSDHLRDEEAVASSGNSEQMPGRRCRAFWKSSTVRKAIFNEIILH